MRIKFVLIIFLTYCFSVTYAQNTHKAAGFEIQQSIEGYQAAIRGEYGFGNHSAVFLRLTATEFWRDMYGVHDDENGVGYGTGLGYRYYFKHRKRGWYTELRADVWRIEVEWIERENQVKKTGITNIIDFQPAILFGYAFHLSRNLRLATTFSIGDQIHIYTKGEELSSFGVVQWGLVADVKF